MHTHMYTCEEASLEQSQATARGESNHTLPESASISVTGSLGQTQAFILDHWYQEGPLDTFRPKDNMQSLFSGNNSKIRLKPILGKPALFFLANAGFEDSGTKTMTP